MPHSLRRRRKIVAALKLPRPESVETEIRRKRRLDSESAEEKETIIQRDVKQMISLIQTRIDELAIIHVSSCNDVLALQKMLATFHVHVPTITCLLLGTCL